MIPKIQNIFSLLEERGIVLPSKKNKFSTIFFKIFLSITVSSLIILTITEINTYLRFHKILDDISRIESIDKFLKQRPEFGVNVDLSESYRKLITSYQPQILNNFLISMGIGLFFALILGIFLSRQISKPLRRLREAIRKSSNAPAMSQVDENGPDEIKSLTKAYNKLIRELKQQEKLRIELTSDISHELKTPITKIRGQIEGMIDGIYKKNNHTLEQILNNIEQLEYLINKIYEVNRLNPKDTKLQLSKCKIYQLVQQAISGYNTNGIEFKIQVDKNLRIHADQRSLQQILDNLISNAYKYTQQGIITIKADINHLTVTDTGMGIPQKEIPLIFKRFYRVEKSRHRSLGGLGLGLFIVKKLVDLHGWKIKVLSQVGKGTSFEIKWTQGFLENDKHAKYRPQN